MLHSILDSVAKRVDPPYFRESACVHSCFLFVYTFRRYFSIRKLQTLNNFLINFARSNDGKSLIGFIFFLQILHESNLYVLHINFNISSFFKNISFNIYSKDIYHVIFHIN